MKNVYIRCEVSTRNIRKCPFSFIFCHNFYQVNVLVFDQFIILFYVNFLLIVKVVKDYPSPCPGGVTRGSFYYYSGRYVDDVSLIFTWLHLST